MIRLLNINFISYDIFLIFRSYREQYQSVSPDLGEIAALSGRCPFIDHYICRSYQAVCVCSVLDVGTECGVDEDCIETGFCNGTVCACPSGYTANTTNDFCMASTEKTVQQLSIMIIYNSTWSIFILIQYNR